MAHKAPTPPPSDPHKYDRPQSIDPADMVKPSPPPPPPPKKRYERPPSVGCGSNIPAPSLRDPVTAAHVNAVILFHDGTFGAFDDRGIEMDELMARVVSLGHASLEQTQLELDEALSALNDLFDEQNGPPRCWRGGEERWRHAMDRATRILIRHLK